MRHGTEIMVRPADVFLPGLAACLQHLNGTNISGDYSSLARWTLSLPCGRCCTSSSHHRGSTGTSSIENVSKTFKFLGHHVLSDSPFKEGYCCNDVILLSCMGNRGNEIYELACRSAFAVLSDDCIPRVPQRPRPSLPGMTRRS